MYVYFSSKTKMARVCVFCDSFSVHILIFLSSLVFYTIQAKISEKEVYFYELDHATLSQEADPLHFNLLDGVQDRRKREVYQPTPSSQLLPVEPITNESDTNFLERIHRKSLNTINKVLVALPVNYTKITPTPFHTRNLGENGTGIFRNLTSSTISPPPSLLIPIHFPMDTNIISKENSTSTSDSNPQELELDNIFNTVKTSFDKYVENNNYAVNKSDTHLYYNSIFTTSPEVGRSMWVDFSNSSKATTNDLLSKSHRRAATVKLSFEFPFYGHLIRNVTIATGGFIYTGDYVHSWLAATQYIAPLMANFDTSISNDSFIKYIDNNTAFTVQWEKVALQEKPDDGQFTFQATLHKNGDIVFAYQNVPDIIKTIDDVYHPVTIGLSDAYLIDHSEDFVRRKTIFEYHKVSFKKEDIKNWTVIYLTALPTCLEFLDCHSCITSDIPNFKCSWCPSTRKCSVGVDRYRNDWVTKGCDRKQIRDPSICQSLYTSVDYNNKVLISDDRPSVESTVFASRSVNVKQSVQMGVSGVVTALFLGALIFAMGMWVVYAYRNPHTTSGQILIRYRPSQWRWRRGEARYTAATIHM